MASRKRVSILLLTGFLGSGKTSLLAKWLQAPEFSGTMVIVNELGEVGIDNRLIETSSEAPLLLDSGCACCAASEDLSSTLQRLFFDRLHRRIPDFSRVLIETTGIAEPAPIIAMVTGHSLLAERYELRGVVTTFDARRGPRMLEAHGEGRKQIAAAQVVILTKTDLADAGDIAAARESLMAVNPQARVLVSARASVTAADLLSNLEAARQAPRGLSDLGPSGLHGHEHSHLTGMSSAFAALPPIARPALETAIERTLAEFGVDLLRLKGIVSLVDEPGLWVVQAEAGLPVEFRPLPARAGDEPPTGMTLIARHVAAQDMAAALLSCIFSASPGPAEERRGL